MNDKELVQDKNNESGVLSHWKKVGSQEEQLFVENKGSQVGMNYQLQNHIAFFKTSGSLTGGDFALPGKLWQELSGENFSLSKLGGGGDWGPIDI